MTDPSIIAAKLDEAAALLELAARCEAATGPDRDLDCAIYNAVPDGPNRKAERLPMGKWGDRFDDGWRTMWADREDKYCEQLKRYTASLDAAMTLMPEGWSVGNISQADPVTGRKPYACVCENHVEKGPDPWDEHRNVEDAEAATPALALVAAALRARAQVTA